jgi:hypothetical protein
MKTWEQKLVDEHAALEVKGNKLADFLAEVSHGESDVSLSQEEHQLLLVQIDAMAMYAVCLEQRMDLHGIGYVPMGSEDEKEVDPDVHV